MKNIFKFIIIVTLSLPVLFSCIDDFVIGEASLEKEPGTELNIDTVFAHAELARQYLWGLYQYLPDPAPHAVGYDMNGSWYETLSDTQHSVLGWTFVNVNWYTGTYNPNDESSSRWGYSRTGKWDGMRTGWIFLENIDRVPDMSDTEKNRLKAEAKIIIAANHWELFRHYGGIPLVDRSYKATDDIYQERGTVEETYNHMIVLLDEAIAEPNLPWSIPNDELSTWYGRLTKAAAMGQKMLVQLHAASPIFNDNVAYTDEEPQEAVEKRYVWWGGYKPELWQELRQTCEDFLAENSKNGNYYQLIQPKGNSEAAYMNAYREAYWNRANSEKIYTTNKFYRQHIRGRIWGGQGREGSQSPTAEFMEMFPNADGTPFDTTGIYIYGLDVDESKNPYDVPIEVLNRPSRKDNYEIFENRDPRLYEVLRVQKRGQLFKSQPDEFWPGGHTIDGPWGRGRTFAAHGMGFMKWVLDFGEAEGGVQGMEQLDYTWPTLRMGGFHLIYAEALAETGNLQAACDQINLVRSRVGLGKIEENNPQLNLTTDKKNLINEILRERAIELGYEDTRFMDMVRRKLTDDFKKQLHGLYTYRVDGNKTINNTQPYPELWYVKRPITQYPRAWWRPGFWTNKWLLAPFPTSEVNKGYGLVQNPGW